MRGPEFNWPPSPSRPDYSWLPRVATGALIGGSPGLFFAFIAFESMRVQNGEVWWSEVVFVLILTGGPGALIGGLVALLFGGRR
jgi:hypothetical protein